MYTFDLSTCHNLLVPNILLTLICLAVSVWYSCLGIMTGDQCQFE